MSCQTTRRQWLGHREVRHREVRHRGVLGRQVTPESLDLDWPGRDECTWSEPAEQE